MSSIVTSSFTLYGKWSRPTFTITFDPNGGRLIGNRTKLVTYGSQYGGLPSAEKENAYFEGWRTPSGELINSKNIVLISEETTLTASWTDKEVFHTVTFVSNGGPSVAPQKVSHGKKIAKPEITRRGYSLDGWFYDKDLEIPWDFENETVDTDITLYADWTKLVIYKITFTTGEGEFPDKDKEKSIEVAKGKRITAPDTPKRDNHTFEGWSLDGTTIYNMSTLPTSDMTLYAVWNKVILVVRFDANGGRFSDDEEVHRLEIDKNETVETVETPTREGYTFKGWYCDGTKWNVETPVKKDMTVFAIWKYNTDLSEDAIIDEVPAPGDPTLITPSKWTFKVIDGVPYIIKED
jgi:uncharacterized repeat protein (TIGR02543 family)